MSMSQSLLNRAGRLVALAGFLMLGQPGMAQTTPSDSPPAATAQPVTPPLTTPSGAAPSTPAPPAAAAPATPGQTEAGPPADGDASTAEALDVVAKPAALYRGQSNWEEGYANLRAAFARLQDEIDKAGLKAAGKPLSVFVETDDDGFRFEAMIPLDDAMGKTALGQDVVIGETPSGKAMKFQHRAAYEEIDGTYEAITAYLDEKGLEARNLFAEEYLTLPPDSLDESLEIDIYVFLK